MRNERESRPALSDIRTSTVRSNGQPLLVVDQTPMFSAIVRREVQPSLRLTHPYSVASASPKLNTGEQAIYDKLSEHFQPSELLVQDVSGAPLSSHADLPRPLNNFTGRCGSFYAITIVNTAFKGITVVKQHRLVNEALKKEIEGIHGLQVHSWFVLVILYIDHSRSSNLYPSAKTLRIFSSLAKSKLIRRILIKFNLMSFW